MKLAADGWAFGTARRDWRRRQHSPLLAVPITVLLYDGPLLCGFNVPIKGLKSVKLVSVFIYLFIYFCIYFF